MAKTFSSFLCRVLRRQGRSHPPDRRSYAGVHERRKTHRRQYSWRGNKRDHTGTKGGGMFKHFPKRPSNEVHVQIVEIFQMYAMPGVARRLKKAFQNRNVVTIAVAYPTSCCFPNCYRPFRQTRAVRTRDCRDRREHAVNLSHAMHAHAPAQSGDETTAVREVSRGVIPVCWSDTRRYLSRAARRCILSAPAKSEAVQPHTAQPSIRIHADL